MIWVWIAYLWHKLVWLTVPPKVIMPRIDVNAPCPGCGHRVGEIRCVQGAIGQPPFIQHKCKVCHAEFREALVTANTEQRPRVIGLIPNA